MASKTNTRGALPLMEQERIMEAAADLWSALSAHGLVDGFGGMEFRRVFPAAVEFIIWQSNMPPEETPFVPRGLFTLDEDGRLSDEVTS